MVMGPLKWKIPDESHDDGQLCADFKISKSYDFTCIHVAKGKCSLKSLCMGDTGYIAIKCWDSTPIF